MDVNERKKEYFQELIQVYPFEERYRNILTQIQDILEALGVLDQVSINTDLLGQAILDYFEDIDRLKKYEDIERVNVDKIYAYETFWLLKRKPIQITSAEVRIEFLHINEKVFTFILIAKLLKEMQKGFDDTNPRMYPLIDLIYYNFKYRLYSQKTLELLISGFFCGCSFSNLEVDANA